MTFIYLRQDENGQRVHNLVHIECTREFITQWLEFYVLRDEARNDRLGDAPQTHSRPPGVRDDQPEAFLDYRDHP